MTPYDFVYTLVLGGVLEESLYDDQVNLLHLLLGVSLWGILIFTLEFISTKSDRLNKLFKGEPSVIVYNGQLVRPALKRNKLEMEQLRALLRTSGCYSLKNAKHMIMETGGQISLTTFDNQDETLSLLLIDEGHIEEKVLENHHLDKHWLTQELKQLGYRDIEQIVYAEWSEEKGLYVVKDSDLLDYPIRLDG
ncbi:DUF421 domain-containing protein [Aerococcaceae bacterium WS4759]|uniref:DUF421 domain-containing protein n=2 Tax=Fundicoccus ignavus TaxID=2664442 RepID=A0A6I2GI06_9LACT|nr:DUF421 domain-containing protein [Fundicoccus ignavus]